MTPPNASHDPYAEPYEDEGDQPLVRPYAMTGGRTRPRYQLAIEALVQGCCRQAALPQATGWFPNRAMPQRVEWMLELFERREHERLRRRARPH